MGARASLATQLWYLAAAGAAVWLALGQPVEGLVGSGVEQVALAVTAFTAWVAARVSLSVWQLVAPGLVASVEGVAAVAVASEAAMEVALVGAEEWEVALGELLDLGALVALVGMVALAPVAALGESRK